MPNGVIILGLVLVTIAGVSMAIYDMVKNPERVREEQRRRKERRAQKQAYAEKWMRQLRHMQMLEFINDHDEKE